MKPLETSYNTHDGKKLYLQAWIPQDPKAQMLLVHGLGEHSGRYVELVQKLNEIGVSVFSFDGRGHGKSSTKNPTAFFKSYEDYLKDIATLYEKVKDYTPGLPTFLYGQSMGGALVAAHVIKSSPESAGVILSSPAIKEAKGTSFFLILISGLISKILPRLKVLKLDPHQISRIPAEVSNYLNDPLIYTKPIPARSGHEILKMMRLIRANAQSFELPLLVIHGSADGLTNPEGSLFFSEKVSSKDKTYHVVAGGFHELIHDTDREEVFGLISDWISKRI